MTARNGSSGTPAGESGPGAPTAGRPSALRRSLELVGALLATASVVFIAASLVGRESALDPLLRGEGVWLAGLALAVAYALASLLLALAWGCLLRHLGERAAPFQVAGIFGVTQLGKYLPGNLGHFLGRQALAMAAGLRAAPVAKSSLLEILCLLAAGAVFTPLLLRFLDPSVTPGTALGALALLGALVLLLAGRLLGRLVAVACAAHAAFLAVTGVLFLLSLEVLDASPPAEAGASARVVGAYVCAWLAGFVTPGASAGIGIREVALTVLLDGLIAPDDVLAAVILGRAISTVGDLLFFLGALSSWSTRGRRTTRCDG